MEEDTHTASSRRSTSILREIETRVVNPLFRSILRSRLHWIVSGSFTLVSYVGRHSGRRYTFPVAYHRLDGAIAVVTPKRESNWWRNFQNPRPCRVWLEGNERTATGELVTGDERDSLIAGYVETHKLLGRMLGVESALEDQSHQLADPNHTVAVVRFVLGQR